MRPDGIPRAANVPQSDAVIFDDYFMVLRSDSANQDPSRTYAWTILAIYREVIGLVIESGMCLTENEWSTLKRALLACGECLVDAVRFEFAGRLLSSPCTRKIIVRSVCVTLRFGLLCGRRRNH